jgi:hypothetical protein
MEIPVSDRRGSERSIRLQPKRFLLGKRVNKWEAQMTQAHTSSDWAGRRLPRPALEKAGSLSTQVTRDTHCPLQQEALLEPRHRSSRDPLTAPAFPKRRADHDLVPSPALAEAVRAQDGPPEPEARVPRLGSLYRGNVAGKAKPTSGPDLRTRT